jgi:hypothetical protein
LDCLYIILYFFFVHWIACTLFWTFSFAIGLFVLYFVLFVQSLDFSTLCSTFSLVIRLFVLYFVLFLWSLDYLYFILYFLVGHWIVCTLFCTFSLVIGLSVL